MAQKTSPDFSAITPVQMMALFQAYLKETHSPLDMLLENGKKYKKGQANKYEWQNAQLSPLSWVVNATHALLTFDPTTPGNLTLTSTAGLKVGMVLRFVVTATGADVGNMQLKIVSITNGTVATATIYGGTTDVAITASHTAKLVSEPIKENEKPADYDGNDGFLPTSDYNYFQIFRKSVELSDTAINTATFGDASQLAFQLKGAFYKFRQEMSEQITRGRRVARVANGENGSFAGILQFIDQSGGNVLDASGGALTLTLLNNLVELIFKNGGMVDTIVCNTAQARKISGLNISGNNPIVLQDSTQVGTYVMRLVSDLPIAGGVVQNIMIDEKMPTNAIAMINLGSLALVPYENRELHIDDATLPGQDGSTAVVRGEYTLVCRDAKVTHGILKNLA